MLGGFIYKEHEDLGSDWREGKDQGRERGKMLDRSDWKGELWTCLEADLGVRGEEEVRRWK